MKQQLLVSLAAVTVAAAGWSVSAGACEHEKGATAMVAASSSKTCTPAERAACKSKTKTTAVTASASSKTTTAMAAGSSCCASKGAKNSAAVAKTNAASHCSDKWNANTAGEMGDGFDAVVVGGSHCSGHGMVKSADKMTHAGCDACADMAMCQDELSGVGAQTQVVPLKNGVMIVYTADAPKNIRAVQTAMARRNDRLGIIASSGEKSTLCPECKYMRGAIASGKLNREIVNIEGGCLTLMTSNDKAVVSRLHAMSGVQTAARVKS